MEEREMKKIITFIAAVAMIAVSCQKENTPADKDSNSQVEGKLTATIVKTKVSYTETASMDLQPSWEVGDKIIGFDDAGNTYTLTVASVSAETATLNGTVPDGALHLIYKSGAKASDIDSKTLAIDYAAQKGDKSMPAVMLADGTVEDGACDFVFTNAGAIIGISAVKGVPSGAAISKFTVEGENLSEATVALSGSALALTAATAASDAISTATLSGVTVTDGNGTLSAPVFIAVPAGAKVAKVSAFVAKESSTMKIPSTASDKEGVDYVTIAGKKWAKWNVGASSPTDYGWYFPWADTEGYFRFANTWQSVKSMLFEFLYTLSSIHTVNASDYLYVKTQAFVISGHNFAWVGCPYQTQNTTSSSSVRFTKYLGSTSSKYKNPSATDADALKALLDLEDDAAYVNWGGSWRMPTSAEFKALKAATYWAWDSTDKGYYVFSPDASHSAGTITSFVPVGLSKTDALLFFPAAGYSYNTVGLEGAGSNGHYWSSSLDVDKAIFGFYLSISSSNSDVLNGGRNYCRSVRPISD